MPAFSPKQPQRRRRALLHRTNPLPTPFSGNWQPRAPEISAGLQAWNGGENLQGSVTQASHLVGKLGQSEMNIAMQGDALGAVQVHTHVSGDQVGAAITVERHDVHTLLINDLPALHQAFSDRQLRLENVSLSQGSLPCGSRNWRRYGPAALARRVTTAACLRGGIGTVFRSAGTVRIRRSVRHPNSL